MLTHPFKSLNLTDTKGINMKTEATVSNQALRGVNVASVLQSVQSHSVSLRWGEPGRPCCHPDAPSRPDWTQLDPIPPPRRSSQVQAAPLCGEETHWWNVAYLQMFGGEKIFCCHIFVHVLHLFPLRFESDPRLCFAQSDLLTVSRWGLGLLAGTKTFDQKFYSQSAHVCE